MKKSRIAVQVLFFLLMFIIPILNMLEIYFIKGTYISLDVGSLSVSDPLAVLQAAFASHSVVPVMLVSAAIPVFIAVFFGRVWCGWGCPYNAMLDLFDYLRRKLRMKPLKPKYSESGVTRMNAWRLALLLFGFFLVGVTGVPLLYLFSPPSLMSAQSVMLLKYFTLTAESLILLILIVVEFFFAYRFWCRFVCPTGALLGIFRSGKGMRIGYKGSCSMCGKCVHVCPMVLDPRKDGSSSSCTNCGVCITACAERGDHALKFKAK